MAEQPRIFVNIASYRDVECQWTVRDLFEKAASPDRLSVGICWQFDQELDRACFEIETRPDQVRRIDVHPSESRGVCWARNRSQSLWQGEEFTLQIDSHMRFVPEWDRHMLEMHAACPTPRSVLSTYPVSYVPPDKLAPAAYNAIQAREFDQDGMLKFKSASQPTVAAPDVPAPSAFVAAGFLFGPGAIIEDVPYDPEIYFHGEEATLAVRLWTHGWDLFTPNRHVIYHDYSKRENRVRHWEDDTDWSSLNRASMRRVRHLLGMAGEEDGERPAGLEEFGLGTERTLDAYQSFAGISFAERTIAGVTTRTDAGQATAANSETRSKTFATIWSNRIWGSEESASGSGSTLAQTAILRARLPGVFRKLGIEVLADAGCGDLNWMAKISGDLRLYLGFDIVDGLVEEMRRVHGERTSHLFSVVDIVERTLPRCDAILCRDCLTHLTVEETKTALRRFRESGSTHLIATTHPGRENREIQTGGWYAMNLEAAPFELPPPELVIDEKLRGTTKSLGVWRLAEVP